MPTQTPHHKERDNIDDREAVFLFDETEFSAESFRAELKSGVEFEKTWTDTAAKILTKSFGTIWFLGATFIFILLWIIINLGWIDDLTPFDTYPFSLLSVIVSLFGIFLSIVVLISQNRQGRIADVRQRIEFEINVRAETEITKILNMLDEIHDELGIAKVDKELEKMKEKIDITEIKEEIEQVILDEDTKNVT